LRVDPEEARAYSAWFETPLGEQVWRDERRAILHLLGPVGGKRILDAGAGDGRLTVELAALGAEVTALDISPAMLSRAERRAEQNGVRITTVEGDLNALPFPPGAFDRVISVTVLCFVSQPLQAVRELARVLVPGESLVIADLGRWSAWNLHRWMRGRMGDPLWSHARFWTRGTLNRLLRHAHLDPGGWASAVFYTPGLHNRRGVRTIENALRDRMAIGAAFLAVRGTKPGVDRRAY